MLRSSQLERFIACAQRHLPVVILLNLEAAKFRCSVTAQGVFTKQCVWLSPSEPDAVRDIFLGTSMSGKYAVGEFRREWLTTWTRGLEHLDGPLKTPMYELVLAIYQVDKERRQLGR